MPDPETIYRGFVGEEAAAARARRRTRPPSQICNDWQQALAARDTARFGDVVDVQGYTENCLGLTGWTTGFHVALRSLQRVHTRDGRVAGMWSQADLYGIYRQLTA